MTFNHIALDQSEQRPLIYTATSKHNFYFRSQISKFVLDNDGVPLNPFMIFDYFLTDTVDRNVVRTANNNLVLRCDEVWVFGAVSDGVLAEVKQAKERGTPVKYFSIVKSKEIQPCNPADVIMEDDVTQFRDLL